MQIRLVGLQKLCIGCDGHGLRQRADLEFDVDAADLPGGHRNVRLHEFAEASQRDFHVVVARQYVCQSVFPLGTGHGLASGIRFFVCDHNGRCGNRSALRILDSADDAAVEHLRGGGAGRHHD